MSDDSRYAIMRRSISTIRRISINSANGVQVLGARRNRIALMIAFCNKTGNNGVVYARPATVATGPLSTFIGWTLYEDILDGTSSAPAISNTPLVLNIWDHGDLVQQDWNVGNSGISGDLVVAEVIDPDIPM